MRRDLLLICSATLAWVSLLGPSGAIPKWLLCPAAYSSIAKGGPELKLISERSAYMRTER